MVEQAAVNRAVVGSSPTEAAIHCQVDELVSRIALKMRLQVQFLPELANIGSVAQWNRASSFYLESCGFKSYHSRLNKSKVKKKNLIISFSLLLFILLFSLV